MIPIQQVKIGDLVYTYKGRFRKVTKTSKDFYKGNGYSIKTYGTSNYETAATGTTPFLTRNRGWVRTEDLTKDDWLPFPINNRVNDISTISVPFVKKIGSNRFGKLETIWYLALKLEAELLTIIDYYLAAGNLNKYHSGQYGRIVYTFSSRETDNGYIVSLIDSLTKIGFYPKTY